jgi:hypothetical protein
MQSASRLDRTRELVTDVFQQLISDVPLPLRETVLIRDGLYRGHRFHCERHSAVWFLEEDQIKFFGPDGRLLRVMACQKERPPGGRQAA